MSANLLETIQQNLGYRELKKVNTATGRVPAGHTTPATEKFSQAAIPAVLVALCRFAHSDKGAEMILQSDKTADWISCIFGGRTMDAVWRISAYAGLTEGEVLHRMNEIAGEAIKLTRESLPVNTDIKKVKVFLEDQQPHILLFLLPVLKTGELLADDTLDDNTNKMEGPVSNLISGIGAAFSKPVTDEETNKPK